MAKPPTLLETTESSQPYGTADWGVAELADAGYTQTEFLLSGDAAGEPYTVRALLRHPVDVSRFSRAAIVEPMHFMGVRSVWPVVQREVLRAGHVWVEIACQPSAQRILQSFDADRYADIHIVDAAAPDAPPEASIGLDAAAGRSFDEVRRESDEFRKRWFEAAVQAPEIVHRFVQALRGGELGVGGVSTVIMAGLSQTGGFVRNFAVVHHEQLSDAAPIFDGYLAMCSGGDAIADIGVPVIEVLAESEMEELRFANLLPGQARDYTHRRADSSTFRLYEVAGMSHSDSRYFPVRTDHELDEGQRWSLFPSTHVVGSILRSLVRWIREGVAPAPSRTFELDADEKLLRDEHGNVRGGFRTAHIDVPTASITVISGPGMSWSQGYEVPFSREKLEQLYGDEAGYRAALEGRLAELVAEGYYLEEDAAEYLADASWK